QSASVSLIDSSVHDCGESPPIESLKQEVSLLPSHGAAARAGDVGPINWLFIGMINLVEIFDVNACISLVWTLRRPAHSAGSPRV
ncbi:hypothetical protein ACE04B_39110, partial [Rhizobium phaseoli]